VRAPLNYFDEGMLLSDAHFLRHGLVAYRDFYSPYPPGAPWLVAGLWWFTGVGALPVRFLGLAVRLAFVLLCGRVAGRLEDRRFSLLAAGLVTWWMAILPLPPYGWRLALLCSVLFLELFDHACRRPLAWRFALAGAALGGVGVFRHDLFGFLAVGLVLYALAPGGWLAAVAAERPARPALAWTALGALVPLLVVWLPVLATAGLQLAFAELVLDQARYVLPARHLPFPTDLFQLAPASLLPFSLPRLLTSSLRGAAPLVVLAPLGAALWIASRRRAQRDSTPLLLCGLLAVAVLPQLLGRTDRIHAVSTVPPALMLASAALGSASRRRGGAVLGLLAVAVLVVPPLAELAPASLSSAPSQRAEPAGRDAGLRVGSPATAAARGDLLRYLAGHTAADERVLFGNATHRNVYANEVDLYFLADRLPATRFAQYDTGMIERAEVQAEIIASLESTCNRVVVLSSAHPPVGPLAGEPLLDTYFATHYRESARFDPYVVQVRSDVPKGCSPEPH
jgi:hypothetical protein